VLGESYKRRRCHARQRDCLRSEITTDLHAVEVKNTSFWVRARLCDPCYRERMRRRRWLAEPQVEPGSLRARRLDRGLSVLELARRTGLSASMVSAVERGEIRSWRREPRPSGSPPAPGGRTVEPVTEEDV
jgi:DNA-binding transcriptional regulator YiaG